MGPRLNESKDSNGIKGVRDIGMSGPYVLWVIDNQWARIVDGCILG